MIGTEAMLNSLEFFEADEFRCPCCKRCPMEFTFVRKLDMARRSLGKPIKINSGYRCPKHNKAVGGSPNSLHMKGQAVDIPVTDPDERGRLLNVLRSAGIKSFAIGPSFIHCDTIPRDRVAVYWTDPDGKR